MDFVIVQISRSGQYYGYHQPQEDEKGLVEGGSGEEDTDKGLH